MSEQTATTTTAAPIEYADHLTISIGVRNLDDAIAWYRDMLGFEVIYKLEEMGWCELKTSMNGVSIGVGQSEEPKTEGTTPVFGVRDIEAARLVRRDVQNTYPPSTVYAATRRAGRLRDALTG